MNFHFRAKVTFNQQIIKFCKVFIINKYDTQFNAKYIADYMSKNLKVFISIGIAYKLYDGMITCAHFEIPNK